MADESSSSEFFNSKRKGKPWLRKCPYCRDGMLLWKPSASVYECLNMDCERVYSQRELNSIRYRALRKVLLFLSLAGACAAIITYTIFYFGGFDRPVAIGISAASAAIFIWNVFNLGRYWRYRLLRVSFSRALFSIVLVLIIGTTLALHTGIGPFSNAGDTTGVVTEPPGPTPTMAPVQLSGEDIGKTRQDGSLKVTLDGVYLLSKDVLGVEISVENAGDSKLVATQFRLVPEAGSIDNPFLKTTHPCNEGIPPGQICYCRLADSTYVEIYSRNLVMQTYLVVYSNDLTGESFGVTFALPETN